MRLRIEVYLTKSKKFERTAGGHLKLFARRTVITFEKLERSSYRLLNVETQVSRCERCAHEVTWLTPNQAVALSGLTLREIFRRIESHKLHFDETPQGLLHICPRSLDGHWRHWAELWHEEI